MMTSENKFRGVRKLGNKWRAEILLPDGTNKHLGYFNFFEDAVVAREEAEDIIGFNGITGAVKEVFFKLYPVRTVYCRETKSVWIVARDILDALGYNPKSITYYTRNIPRKFTGTVYCDNHTRSYVGITIEGALILLADLRTKEAAEFRKWILAYLYPRTECSLQEQVSYLKASIHALSDVTARL